jgi:hypothetical protein
MRKNLIKKIRKLLKLKNYVTTQEAAQYLTILLGIEVSQAQVLRFALDGSLKLSVYFANSVKAKRGEIVHKDEVASEDAPSKEGLPSLLDRMVDIGDGQYIKLDEDVVSLSGLSDLAMVRSEQLSVEKMYQKLVGGLEVSLEDECEGAFVENEFGFFKLQERIHLDYQKYLSTDLENIKKLIKYNKLDA